MKKNHLFFLALTSIIFVSCSKESKIQSKVNEYVEKNFNDPKSYELIELKLIDTLTRKKAAKYIIEYRQDTINAYEDYIKSKNKEISDRAMSAFLGGPALGLEEEVNELKKEKEALKEYSEKVIFYQKENERLKKYLNQNDIVYYRYKHDYRTKNETGVLIKYTDTIRFDTKDNIIENYKTYIIKNLAEK